jgi:hypothetical protein
LTGKADVAFAEPLPVASEAADPSGAPEAGATAAAEDGAAETAAEGAPIELAE